jgi:hypothetical protein
MVPTVGFRAVLDEETARLAEGRMCFHSVREGICGKQEVPERPYDVAIYQEHY